MKILVYFHILQQFSSSRGIATMQILDIFCSCDTNVVGLGNGYFAYNLKYLNITIAISSFKYFAKKIQTNQQKM